MLISLKNVQNIQNLEAKQTIVTPAIIINRFSYYKNSKINFKYSTIQLNIS